MKVSKLTAQHLDRAYMAWLKEGLSPTTVHHIHSAAMSALPSAAGNASQPGRIRNLRDPCSAQSAGPGGHRLDSSAGTCGRGGASPLPLAATSPQPRVKHVMDSEPIA